MARLVAYSVSLCRRYPPNGVPGPDGFRDPPYDDALREGALVHLRLLDEFLGSRSDKRDAKAADWVSGWTRSCLSVIDRERIDRQVVHLSLKRDPSYPWELGRYTTECLTELQRFLDALVPGSQATKEFAETRRLVEDGLADLAAILT